MGRKQKKGSKASQTGIQHKEAFQRMNYLFQAAVSALSATPSQPGLSRFYIHTMKTISTRLVLRMDPSMKRMLCKSCDSLLVAGVTCTHRLRSGREKHVVVKCLTCGTLKRFLTNNDYQLWSEKTENIHSPPTAGPTLSSKQTEPSVTKSSTTTEEDPQSKQTPEDVTKKQL